MALTFFSLGSAACGPGPARDDASRVILAPSEVHILGSSESIGEVQDLAVLPDGTVWVFNSVEPYFIRFGADGTPIEQYGRKGGGPEEFPMPAGFVSGGLDGEAWVLDVVRHAFIRVAGPGVAWRQIPIPRDQIPLGAVRGGMNLMSSTVRTARLGDEFLVPWTTGTLAAGVSSFHMSLLRADISAVNAETGAARRILVLGDVLDDPSAGFEATDGGFPLWYRLWAVCDGRIRVYDRVRNQLRGFTGSGQEVVPIDLPPPQLTVATAVEFARAILPLRQAEVTGGVGVRMTSADSVRLVDQLAHEVEGDGRQLAAYLPRYVDFRCSDDGSMWLQPIDLDAGGLQGSRAWVHIEDDGTAREVRFPERFDPVRFETERIWGIQRDELDVPAVAWVRGLKRPGAGG